MAFDDDDESLAKFLESEVLSEISDEEEKRDEGFEEEDEDRVVRRMVVTEDDASDEAEEEREARRKQVEEEDIIEVETRKEEEENEEAEEKEVNKMLIEEGAVSGDEEEGAEREMKRRRFEEVYSCNEVRSNTVASSLMLSIESKPESSSPKKNNSTVSSNSSGSSTEDGLTARRIETGILSKVPPELFRHILKFLSSEDLVSCSLVCRFLNYAASDESLWRRLYTLRWGLQPKKLRDCAWKKLYIQRDEDDMTELVRNCPSEFKEYYIQMQAAKRSQAPLPSQVLDDRIVLDKTITDQVSMWKSCKGLTDKVVSDHACSGETCTYYQIGDVFVCERTGNVHGSFLFIQYVMIHAEKLLLILQTNSWSALFQAVVLTDYSPRQKWNQIMNYNMVASLMKQSHSWGLVVLLEPIYWDIIVPMRRSLKLL